jgi:hypothetical protein
MLPSVMYIVLRITNKKKPVLHSYTMHGFGKCRPKPIFRSSIYQHAQMGYAQYINNILAKANKSLGFLRRNISKFSEEIKKRAYQAIVRPNVEYASSVWDPYHENHIKKIEMMQRR